MIYVISSKKPEAFGLDKKVKVEILPRLPDDLILKSDDQVYFDISGLSGQELKKSTRALKKRCAGNFWGIIDPKSSAEDPASFFFEGACDYIGRALIKNGIVKKRFVNALSWKKDVKNHALAVPEKDSETSANNDQEKITPHEGFQGWKSIRPGKTARFFFLFVSFTGGEARFSSGAGKLDIRSQAGEAAFVSIKNRLREVMQQNLKEADAMLWIEAEDTSLFLVPPTAANGKAAIEAALKMILNSRVINLEKLGLLFPVEFTFALHCGDTVYQAPGKTGGVISEPVNYIFHLGTRKAEAGRLTISGEIPEEVLPEGLSNLFTNAGVFEGIPLRHSRRFSFK